MPKPWDHIKTPLDALQAIRESVNLDWCEGSGGDCAPDEACRIHKVKTILDLFDGHGKRVTAKSSGLGRSNEAHSG